MQFGAVPIQAAVDHILAHRVLDAAGHTLLTKGRRLTTQDIILLGQHQIAEVVVANLTTNDLHEDAAAERVGLAVVGPGLRIQVPGVGRANVLAEVAGPLRINVAVLARLNNIDEGITIATLREHTLVQPGQLVTLVKIIPFGVPLARVQDIEATAQEAAPVLSVRPLQPRSVGLLLSGPTSTHARLIERFAVPVRTRVERLNSKLESVLCVTHDPAALALGLQQLQAQGRELLLVAGISAISDRNDVIPQALTLAGGSVAHFGLPVDPGSLTMVGYLGDTPVIGAPSCIQSAKTNVIDLLLPRLLAGERLTRADLVSLGHGGLLEDIPERPMPRTG